MITFNVYVTSRLSADDITAIQVTVQIEDINDNAPQFRPRTVRKSVQENSALGLRVSLPKAVDPDKGNNSVQYYRLVNPIDGWVGLFLLGVSEVVPNWVRLAPNDTNLGLFKISFQYILARGTNIY